MRDDDEKGDHPRRGLYGRSPAQVIIEPSFNNGCQRSPVFDR